MSKILPQIPASIKVGAVGPRDVGEVGEMMEIRRTS